MTDDPATSARDPRDEMITREDAARAEAALARLPERYREAVVLYYGGDESIADVASALGISQDSARQRVHRGRARLRDLLSTVETAVRATRPTAAFTAACVAAWSVGKPAPAHAAASPTRATAHPARSSRRPLALGIGAGVLALGATTAIVVGSPHGQDPARATAATSSTSDPRSTLHRRFPTSPRPVPPAMLPHGTFALGRSSPATSMSMIPPPAPKLVELDFQMAPFVDLMRLFRNELDTPIWVAYETDATIDVNTHGKRPTIDVFDEVLDSAGANRAEVAAIRITPGGRTDAAVLGGEPITATFDNTPLNFVLDALEPKLGMPIGRLGVEVLPGQTDGDGKPAVEQSPPITLDLHAVPAGAALEKALLQAGVGYELTTGFVILPR